MVFALGRLGRLPSPVQFLLFGILSLAAMVLLYAFNLIIQTTTFWFINIEQADTLVQGFLETGRFPIQFYRGWIRGLLTAVIPIAFMTTFPAQALLGELSWWTVAAAIGMAILLFILASAFWKYALQYYTGASS